MASIENPVRFHLTALAEGIMPGLTRAYGAQLAEAAAVCLENREHKSGVTFHLTGWKGAQFLMEWAAIDERARRSNNDLQEATERGAYGIAILIVCHLTGMVVLERSAKGRGFDYWLGDEEEDGDELFQKKARLEVSGILSGSHSEVQARVRRKQEQMKPSDRLAPGYVAVVEFGTPIACVETK
jgi:succinate dehydrogenase/fumarate reductase flavoprotein subunit